MSTLPFNEVAGEPLNTEQAAYLEGLFAGIENRGLRFSDVEGTPMGGIDEDDLTVEERIKNTLHPLDAHHLLLEHARENKPPEKENVFRFKWNGLFYLSPNKDGFMARLRIPGGQLRSFQLREIAKVADELTTGYVQITTRANFQIRLIEPKDAPAVVQRIQSVGLHSRGAGADNIRNLTASPTAGIDQHRQHHAGLDDKMETMLTLAGRVEDNRLARETLRREVFFFLMDDVINEDMDFKKFLVDARSKEK